ncbi:MAG: nucleotide exchange factor GrpE [Bacteroidetes bacterium]|nr:nucleotide exchange factor GrpE [Bacteroidota bacterium]
MKSKEESHTMDEPNKAEMNSGESESKVEAATEGLPDAEQQESGALAKLELELSAAKDKYLRLYSDFDNYKKRINRERVDLIMTAGQDVMTSILPMLDDMERAIKAMSEAKSIDAVKEGIQLVYHKMKTITEGKGLKPMNAVGTDFDADLHDAIANVPVTDEKQKGKVIEEIEKGYYLNEKVIRHAKVIVGN